MEGDGTMKKPEARGPSPARKAKNVLRQKLNRPFKPPPLPNELQSPRFADSKKPLTNG